MNSKDGKNVNKVLIFIIFILVIIILLLLLRGCKKKENVENDNNSNNNGNVIVFELKCEIDCSCKDDSKNSDKKDDNKGNNTVSDNSNGSSNNIIGVNNEIDNNEEKELTISVLDSNKTWNENTDINLFENSSDVVKGKIAPESSGVYQFIIKNSTSFDVNYNINFEETNSKNLNMRYKLKKNDDYVISNWSDYSKIKQEVIRLNSNSSDTYYLEWKWFEGPNDNTVGKDINSKYKLSINIRAEQIDE